MYLQHEGMSKMSVCVFECVEAGVLAEGILKRLTSRAARIMCVNRTIYNIYTDNTYTGIHVSI